jgi:hypothetical protein
MTLPLSTSSLYAYRAVCVAAVNKNTVTHNNLFGVLPTSETFTDQQFLLLVHPRGDEHQFCKNTALQERIYTFTCKKNPLKFSAGTKRQLDYTLS